MDRTKPPSYLISGIVLALGLALAGLFAWMIVLPEWRANHVYREGTCVVLDKRLHTSSSRSRGGHTYRPEIHIEYRVDGVPYRVWTYDAAAIATSNRSRHEAILASFVVGQESPCWYDPDDPSQAVLARGTSWWFYLFLLLPLAAVWAGGWLLFRRIQWAGSD